MRIVYLAAFADRPLIFSQSSVGITDIDEALRRQASANSIGIHRIMAEAGYFYAGASRRYVS